MRRNENSENCPFMWIFPRILKLLVQIASMFSVKYFCSQQTIVEEEIQEVELRFWGAQFTGTVMHLTVCYTIGEKKGYFYGRVSGKIPFLTIPPHSQLIHNHDAEVCAPIKASF